MRNASSIFKEIVRTPGRQWDYKVRITLSDGYTVYNIKGTELVEGGIILHDTVSEATEFKVGGVSTRILKLGLINFNEKYTNVSFEGAEVEIQIGMVVEQNWEKGKVWEWLNFGSYTCEGSAIQGLVVWLPLFARTFNFDESYSRSNLQYPATLRQILEDACDCCGITLMTHEFTNDDYVVDVRPDTDRTTFRHVIFDLLQLAGCFMRFDEYGRMCLGWYDEGAEPCCRVEYPDMWTFDIVVTGIRSRNYLTDEEVFVGTEDYVLDFTENILAQNNLGQALKNIGKKIFGFSFRPFEGAIHADPSIEAGDPVLLVDRKGREYRSYAMEVDWTIGKPMELGAYSKTVRNNNSNLPSGSQVALAESKKAAEKKINIYDTYAKQFAAMTANSMGFFQTVETLDDGSQIVYQHNKPKREESKTIWKKSADTLSISNDGGKTWRGLDKDGNAVLTVLAAEGIVADWIKTGVLQSATNPNIKIDLTNGELKLQSASGKGLIIDKDGDAHFSEELKIGFGKGGEYLTISYDEEEQKAAIWLPGIIKMHYLEADFLEVNKIFSNTDLRLKIVNLEERISALEKRLN